MLYPQNGGSIVTTDPVTSLHPVYNVGSKSHCSSHPQNFANVIQTETGKRNFTVGLTVRFSHQNS